MNACVIDGGLSTALEEAGHSLDDRLSGSGRRGS